MSSASGSASLSAPTDSGASPHATPKPLRLQLDRLSPPLLHRSDWIGAARPRRSESHRTENTLIVSSEAIKKVKLYRSCSIGEVCFCPPGFWPRRGAGQQNQANSGWKESDPTMWIWYLLLGSGSGTKTAESQSLPGNNFTTVCNIPGNFMCGDGMCVPGDRHCDRVPDCLDGSDERDCSKVKSKFPPTFFACANGVHRIIGRFRCNGFDDCPDGSDEENCTGNPLVCLEARFKCRNGRCVDRSFLCDGQDNCSDNSDEELCSTTAEAPGFVTSDHSSRYYPSITYGVIGSAVIFVSVVASLALVLHHQRKRSVPLPRSVSGSTHHHQPLSLSRLVISDRGHIHAGVPGLSPGSNNAPNQYSPTPQALHSLSGTMYPSSVSLDSPPSYSESVSDVSRPPWFDLPPPPYIKDVELSSEGNLPQYEDLQDCSSHPTDSDSTAPPPRATFSDSQTCSNPREESDQS